MITPSTQEISIINNVSNISKSNKKKEESYYNTIILSSKPRTMERFLSSFKRRNKDTTPNITNNFNMIDEDLYEKEVNISNLNDNENSLDNISDKQKNKYVYVIDDIFIVEPNETWILQDFDDVRVTLVTCTDDGTQRLTVVGKLSDNKKQSEK